MFKTLIIVTTLLALSPSAEPAPMGPLVPVLSSAITQLMQPGTLSTFMKKINNLVGPTATLFQGSGYKYNEVYNTQLLYQVLNAFLNNEQRKKEEEQEKTLHEDLNNDNKHFVIITALLSIITAISFFIAIIITMKLLKKWQVEKIRQFEFERELRQAVLAQRVSRGV